MEQQTNGQQPIDTWAVLELMGHRQIAGRVSEHVLGGQVLVRVDVPAAGGWDAHTKYFGAAGVYGIHPCSESVARAAAEQLARSYGYTPMPVQVPELEEARQTLAQLRSARASAPQPAGVLSPGWDEEDEDDFDDDLPL